MKKGMRRVLEEVIDDVLRRLPTKKEGIKPYEIYNAIPTFRRIRRANAYSKPKGRSTRNSIAAEWMVLQKNRSIKPKI